MQNGIKLRRTRPESRWFDHPEYPGFKIQLAWMSTRRLGEIMAPMGLEITGWRDQRLGRGSVEAMAVTIACRRQVSLESVIGWEGLTGKVLDGLTQGEITLDAEEGDTPEATRANEDAVTRMLRDGIPFSKEWLEILLDNATLTSFHDLAYRWRTEWNEEVGRARAEGEDKSPTLPGP
jgi:hypothetical protein